MNIDNKKLPLIFNVYKPVGPSSFQVVHQFKKFLGYNYGKIGHFGTLDPFAEGVLLIGVQGAQRLNEYVHEFMPKTYRATGLFGKKTTSGDDTSEVVKEQDIDSEFFNVKLDHLEELFREKFLGEYWQAPHMVSAARYNGRRLYDLAKSGTFVELDKKKREILDFKILSYNYPEITFEATVSSGTYIRSLFEEMSELLGGVGHLVKLKRMSIGSFHVDDAIVREDWPKENSVFSLDDNGICIDEAFHIKKIYLNTTQTKRYINGLLINIDELDIQHSLDNKQLHSEDYFWVYSDEKLLVGMAKMAEDKLQSVFNLNFYVLGLQS